MHNPIEVKKARQTRTFRVGLVGATEGQRASLNRIFSATQYRLRAYRAVPLPADRPGMKRSVDFVVVCSVESAVINAWARQADNEHSSPRPLVLLTRSNSPVRSRYQLGSPVNPGKLVKLLDEYTVKELKFIPEFEIGNDPSSPTGATAGELSVLQSAKAGRQRATADSLRAMVVDDSLTVRQQMKIEFGLLGDHVDVFESGEAGLAAAAKRRYDIIFLDVVMPGIDGYNACKQIKRSHLNQSTPVIMLTSRSSSFDKIKGTLAGCSAYLVKPVNHNEFEAVYRKHTKGRLERQASNIRKVI